MTTAHVAGLPVEELAVLLPSVGVIVLSVRSLLATRLARRRRSR